MADKTDDFQPTERSRLRRVHERGHYDRKTVHAILDEALVCHLSFIVDAKPAVIPTAHWRHGNRLYVHGSAASRAMRASTGSEVAIAVTLVDGMVLARSAFHHSLNYRSVILYGEATIVDDAEAKESALKHFVEKLYPGRWPELRPVTEQELKATTVLYVELDEVSAKVRTGPPKDDEEDYALDVWAGVVPLELAPGQPEPDARLKDGIKLPDYLAGN